MTKPYYLCIELNGLPKNANARMHWRVRAQENIKWKQAVAWAVAARRPGTPLKRAKLTCTRYSTMPMDFDNIVAGFKAIIDGLVVAGVLEDDKCTNIGSPTFLWEKCKPKQGKVKVVIEEILE